MRTCRVVAVDVGSVRGRFAWASLDLPQGEAAGGSDPESTVLAVQEALLDDMPVALGFEAPLTLPVPAASATAWTALGSGRTGEGNRPWSAGAGSGALATGLVQVAWVLDRLTALVGGVGITTDPHRWLEGGAQVLIWEAFVSGPGKPAAAGVGQHAADAAAAAETFAERWRASVLVKSDVTCAPHRALNLAALAAQTAGHLIDAGEVRREVAVYRTHRATSSI